MGMDVRDDRGRFGIGNSASPGRPPRQTEKAYMRILMQTCSLQDWAEISARAIADAKNGDASARLWLSRYVCGNPNKSAPSPLDLEIEAAAGSEGKDFDQAVMFHRLRSG
jgi:hypothetical protein